MILNLDGCPQQVLPTALVRIPWNLLPFPLARPVILTLKYHPHVNFTNFYSLWPQKSDHRSLLCCGALWAMDIQLRVRQV